MSNLITISGVSGFIDKNGTAQLNADNICRGLGFIQIKNNTEYVRWERVNGYLTDMGFPHLVGKEFYPENVFYRLAMKGETESAQKFQSIVADEILPAIRKTGTYSVEQSKISELEVKNKNAEARLKNAQTRQANFLLENLKKYKHILCAESVELLTTNAFEMIAGKNALPRPKVETKYYTASEIAVEAGVSSKKIGIVANANNLKTSDYGHMVLDKSRSSIKQVETFRYNESGRNRLLQLLGKSEVASNAM